MATPVSKAELNEMFRKRCIDLTVKLLGEATAVGKIQETVGQWRSKFDKTKLRTRAISQLKIADSESREGIDTATAMFSDYPTEAGALQIIDDITDMWVTYGGILPMASMYWADNHYLKEIAEAQFRAHDLLANEPFILNMDALVPVKVNLLITGAYCSGIVTGALTNNQGLGLPDQIGEDGESLHTALMKNNALVDTAIRAMFAIAQLIVVADIEDRIFADIEEVIRSNMSKFDTEELFAQQSLQKYLDKGLNVVTVKNGEYYVVTVAGDQDVNGAFYPDGKFLKSINFSEPQYDPLGDETFAFFTGVARLPEEALTSDQEAALIEKTEEPAAPATEELKELMQAE